MSDLSEAATERENAVGSDAGAPLRTRAPFDFRLKLNRDGERSADREIAPFDPSTTPRAPEPFVPTTRPEPALIEPMVFSLDLSSIPDLIPTEAVIPAAFDHRPADNMPAGNMPAGNRPAIVEPVRTADEHDPIKPSTLANDSGADVFQPSPNLIAVAPGLPSLPRAAPRPTAVDTTPGEPRPFVPNGRITVDRRGGVPVPKPTNRSPVGKILLGLILVFGLLGGGGFLLIKHRDEAQSKAWSKELQPLSTFVETTLKHPFKKSVTVTTLAQAEYEAKLGIYELNRIPKDPQGGFSGLRALGLIDSDPSPAAVGEYIGITRPSFYDPTTATIYESPRPAGATATPFFDAKLIASLSAALLDQYKDWGDAMATLSPSQRLGYLSLIEGAGVYVVRLRNTGDTTDASAYRTENTDRVAKANALATTISPWVLGALTMNSASSWGIVTRAGVGDFFEALNAPASDAAVLDSARGLGIPAAVKASDPSTVGMYFWYGVLYPALGSEAAFRLATSWTGDSVTYTATGGLGCIRASIATRDSASLAELVAGLDTWVKTRPVSSTATVDGKGTVAVVEACEPTEPVPLGADSQVASHIQGRLVQEQVLLQQMARYAMPLTDPSVACAVNSYRTDGVVGFEAELTAIATDVKGTLSANLTKTLQDLATFCGSAR